VDDVTPSIPPIPVPPIVSTKPCRFCCEPIDPRATVCKHCRTDLSIRRYLTLSNTTLALFTALIAVVGTFAPAIKNTFVPNTSQLRARFVNFTVASDKLFATFIVTNAGGQPGVVGNGSLYMAIKGSDNTEMQASFNLLTNPPIMIGPGNTAIYTLNVDVANPLFAPANAAAIFNQIFAKLQELPKKPATIQAGVVAPEIEKGFCGARLAMWNYAGPKGLLIAQIPCEEFSIMRVS
jgi:hypothetical protein